VYGEVLQKKGAARAVKANFNVEVTVAILETPMRTYWLYVAPDCVFAFYDGVAAFDRVPRTVLEELSAAKRVGEFKIEIRRERGVAVYVKGRCVGVKLRPKLTIVKGKYGVYVVRGRRIPVAPEEDLHLLFSVV